MSAPIRTRSLDEAQLQTFSRRAGAGFLPRAHGRIRPVTSSPGAPATPHICLVTTQKRDRHDAIVTTSASGLSRGQLFTTRSRYIARVTLRRGRRQSNGGSARRILRLSDTASARALRTIARANPRWKRAGSNRRSATAGEPWKLVAQVHPRPARGCARTVRSSSGSPAKRSVTTARIHQPRSG